MQRGFWRRAQAALRALLTRVQSADTPPCPQVDPLTAPQVRTDADASCASRAFFYCTGGLVVRSHVTDSAGKRWDENKVQSDFCL